jgi:hypothetical protein
VAEVLVAEGHHVRTVAERRGTRTPDLIACATSVEVKSFQSLGERGGRPPSAGRVANKILDARGQGAVAVLWGGDSGLTQSTARAGYGAFCERALDEGLGRLRAVRVIGEGFDLSFRPAADLRLAHQAARQTARQAARQVAGPAQPAEQRAARQRTAHQQGARQQGARQQAPQVSLGGH